MRAVERFFTAEQDEYERWKFLREHLGFDRTEETYRFGLYGGVDAALEDYNEFTRSGRVVYPFSGGRRQQPNWVLSNFKTLDLLKEFFALDKIHGPKVMQAGGGSPAEKLKGKKNLK